MNAFVSRGKTSKRWILNVITDDFSMKSFYLGQKDKFCKNYLKENIDELYTELGIENIRKKEDKYRLGKTILNKIGFGFDDEIHQLDSYSLFS